MKYSIDITGKDWATQSKQGKSYLLAHVLEWNGMVDIYFTYREKRDTYSADNVCIPLFLYEMDKFVSSLNNDFPVCWQLGFSPFCYGVLDKEDMLISTRDGKNFDKSIIDLTRKHELEIIKQQLEKNIKFFGRIIQSSNIK